MAVPRKDFCSLQSVTLPCSTQKSLQLAINWKVFVPIIVIMTLNDRNAGYDICLIDGWLSVNRYVERAWPMMVHTAMANQFLLSKHLTDLVANYVLRAARLHVDLTKDLSACNSNALSDTRLWHSSNTIRPETFNLGLNIGSV
jgi:hypothetical protein